MSQTERIIRFGPVNDDHLITLFKGDDINKLSHFPQIMVYGLPKKAEGFSPEERLKGAPWNSAGYKNHSHSTDDFDDHNYDRHEGYGGPYLPKPVHTKPAYDTDYGMGSPEGAGGKPSFVPPAGMHQQYTAPVSTSPKKDTYPETARYRPIGRNPPTNNSKPAHDNGKVSAHAMTRPGKEGHQQTIDCNEARERYGGISVNQPKPEKEYMGTIDCREAATKYNGVFVP